jgi:uncharacterized protein
LAYSLEDKKNSLAGIIGRERAVAVACSGGVDSTLVLKASCDVLGCEDVLAVFVDTPLLPTGENEAVKGIIKHIGCRLHIVRLDPLAWPDFTANPKNRCYLCKKRIYRTLQAELAGSNIQVFFDGTNLDDLSDERPGLKALEELGIRTPLAEAGLTKKDVRRLSRDLGLPTWDKLSSSCLATRIAPTQKITPEKLDLVQKCEGFLKNIDYRGCRVRISHDSAVVELLEDDIKSFVQAERRRQIVKKFNDYGIKRVFVNIVGRQGIVL